MGAPWTLSVPGTVVNVVKSMAEASECVPVSFDMSVDCDLVQCWHLITTDWTYLANRRKPHEAYRCNTCPGDIEAKAPATSPASSWRADELPSKLRELCLEQTQVVARGLVLLGCKTPWRA